MNVNLKYYYELMYNNDQYMGVNKAFFKLKIINNFLPII